MMAPGAMSEQKFSASGAQGCVALQASEICGGCVERHWSSHSVSSEAHMRTTIEHTLSASVSHSLVPGRL